MNESKPRDTGEPREDRHYLRSLDPPDLSTETVDTHVYLSIALDAFPTLADDRYPPETSDAVDTTARVEI